MEQHQLGRVNIYFLALITHSVHTSAASSSSTGNHPTLLGLTRNQSQHFCRKLLIHHLFVPKAAVPGPVHCHFPLNCNHSASLSFLTLSCLSLPSYLKSSTFTLLSRVSYLMSQLHTTLYAQLVHDTYIHLRGRRHRPISLADSITLWLALQRPKPLTPGLFYHIPDYPVCRRIRRKVAQTLNYLQQFTSQSHVQLVQV